MKKWEQPEVGDVVEFNTDLGEQGFPQQREGMDDTLRGMLGDGPFVILEYGGGVTGPRSKAGYGHFEYGVFVDVVSGARKHRINQQFWPMYFRKIAFYAAMKKRSDS